MNRMKIVATVIAALSLLLIASSVSLACVCNVRSLSKRKSESRNVFVGTLIKRTQESQNGRILWRNQFAVERYWKGINVNEITVYTTSDDCASWFELGQRYLCARLFCERESPLRNGVLHGHRSNREGGRRLEETRQREARRKSFVVVPSDRRSTTKGCR